MKLTQEISRVVMCVGLAGAMPAAAVAQGNVGGGPLTGSPVPDAPFSAAATTTVWQTLEDGSRIERQATARYFRDRTGRVRIEQTITGEPQKPPAERLRIMIHPDLAERWVYTLDPVRHLAAKGSRELLGLTVGGGDTFAVPLGWARFMVFSRGHRLLQRVALGSEAVTEESLGTRRIAGVEAIGRRLTTTIRVGQWDNEQAMEIVEDRWESPELKLVIYARQTNPRTGDVVEYRLTNIRRAEPPSDLFEIPADYTLGSFMGSLSLEYAEPPKEQERASGRRR